MKGPLRNNPSFRQPKLEKVPCSLCKVPCKSNDPAPMCKRCQEVYEEAAEEQKAKTRELNSRAKLAEAQVDVVLNGAAAHGQAVKILDSMLDCFGGPEGLAKAWYADCLVVITEKSGTASSQLMFRKIAEFVLQVSRTAQTELRGIDNMDRDEVENELQKYANQFGVVSPDDPEVINIEDKGERDSDTDDDQDAVA